MSVRISNWGGAQRRPSCCLRVATLILAGVAFTLLNAAQAQSTRPGWGSTPYHDGLGTGVTFRVWAPNATSVFVPGEFNSWSTTANPLGQDLTNGVWNGVWSADVSTAVPGQQYKYYINYSGGSVWKHDPRSRWVTNPGNSTGANDIIYDPTAFDWSGDTLTPPALNDLVVYELHMGTFPSTSVPNRFLAATNNLDYLKSLGVSAVEVLPIADFGNSGSSMGYDPAQPFAVDNVQYGGPDGFKTFVQACHARGLAVLLDVVHNHYGPNLLDMWNFDGYSGGGPLGGGGIYFYESNTNLQITPWGYTRPNFASNQVCNFIQDNFTMWLDECHVDGFRWDSADTMMHDNQYNYITAAGNLINAINDMMHTNYSGKISIAEDVYNYIGFDSSWDTTYPGTVTSVLSPTADSSRNMGTIANAVQNNVRYGGTASLKRVAFLESHDVVYGPNGGRRLVTAIDSATPNSYRARKLSTLGAAILFTEPGVPMIFQGQEMLENQAFNSNLNVDWSKTNTYSGIVQLYRDLIRLRRNLDGDVPGLKGDQCSMLQTDNGNKLIAYHRWQSSTTGQDAVVIANFSGIALNNYTLSFPQAGNWYVHFNSDSTNYGTDYSNVGAAVVSATGSPATAQITIGPYSALILSQVSWPPQITLSQAGGVATVTWPSAYGGWVLDTTTTLTGTPIPWVQVPPAQYQTNSTGIYFSSPLSAVNAFYRLRLP